jgi:hypothetical protein
VLDWIEHCDVERRDLSDLFVSVFQQVLARPAAEH